MKEISLNGKVVLDDTQRDIWGFHTNINYYNEQIPVSIDYILETLGMNVTESGEKISISIKLLDR